VADTSAYTGKIQAGVHAEAFSESVPGDLRRSEQIAFALRTNRGVPREWLQPWSREVAEFERDGFFSGSQDRVYLTRRGKMVADTLAQTFVSAPEHAR
jgi:oxygen-independent coproporphyrinogen-3 oxidase